ncbi:MAG: helix-turn-helix transcriptional regulator [Angustibacter sp.]
MSKNPATPRPKITVAQLCADLEITRSTFYDWRAKKAGPPCFKLPNGEIRIYLDDYNQWLAQLERSAA